MKAEIFFFHGGNSPQEKQSGYEHKEQIPAWKVWDVAQDIFSTGLNVMILHESPDKITLMVDDKRFRQR